jgi:hypothetical protein
MSETGGFLGVLIGAALGALFGWWLMMRENERLAYRRVNEEHLRSLSNATIGYLVQAGEAEPAGVEFIARSVRGVGAYHMRGNEDSYTPEERNALTKYVDDLEAAVRAIGGATDIETKSDLYDEWTARLETHWRVLWRQVLENSAPGWRSLFRSYD